MAAAGQQGIVSPASSKVKWRKKGRVCNQTLSCVSEPSFNVNSDLKQSGSGDGLNLLSVRMYQPFILTWERPVHLLGTDTQPSFGFFLGTFGKPMPQT